MTEDKSAAAVLTSETALSPGRHPAIDEDYDRVWADDRIEKEPIMTGIGAEDGGMTPSFDVGDRVLVVGNIGGLFRPRVREGTPGIVIARGVDDQYTVAFGLRTEAVAGHKLIASPDRAQPAG